MNNKLKNQILVSLAAIIVLGAAVLLTAEPATAQLTTRLLERNIRNEVRRTQNDISDLNNDLRDSIRGLNRSIIDNVTRSVNYSINTAARINRFYGLDNYRFFDRDHGRWYYRLNNRNFYFNRDIRFNYGCNSILGCNIRFLNNRYGFYPFSSTGYLNSLNYYAQNLTPIQFIVVDENGNIIWISPVITPHQIGLNNYVFRTPLNILGGYGIMAINP